jgi:hypothetical protein
MTRRGRRAGGTWHLAVGLVVVVAAVAPWLAFPAAVAANVPCDGWVGVFSPARAAVGQTVVVKANSCDGTYCQLVDHDPLQVGLIRPRSVSAAPTRRTTFAMAGTGAPGSVRTFRFVVPHIPAGRYRVELKCDATSWIPIAHSLHFQYLVVLSKAPDTAISDNASGERPRNDSAILALTFGVSILLMFGLFGRRRYLPYGQT